MSFSSVRIIVYAGSLWAGVTVLFYSVLPLVGMTRGYNTSPVAISMYYAFWIGIVAYLFADVYKKRASSWRDVVIEGVLSLGLALGATLFLWIFSQTKVPTTIPVLEPVTDLILATPWYFLPKSVEILFQQMLIAALVFSLAETLSIRAIVLIYASLFGGAHLFMLFGGTFPPTVLIMTLAAVTSAAFFPYLLLRVRHGFLYCYSIHWVFYALLAMLLRIASG